VTLSVLKNIYLQISKPPCTEAATIVLL